MKLSGFTAIGSSVLLALACAAPPPSHFYTLGGAAAPTPAGPAFTQSVAVGPVQVPALVDRPQMVLGVGTHQVRLDEFNRWAAPLADNIARVLRADLAQALGTQRVWSYAQAGVPKPDLQVSVDVQRFDTRPGESVLIEVFWAVKRGDGGVTRTGRSVVRETPAAAGIEAAVAAHSRAMAQVGDDIATAIRAP